LWDAWPGNVSSIRALAVEKGEVGALTLLVKSAFVDRKIKRRQDPGKNLKSQGGGKDWRHTINTGEDGNPSDLDPRVTESAFLGRPKEQHTLAQTTHRLQASTDWSGGYR